MKYKVDFKEKSAMQKALDANPDKALDMSYDAMYKISLAISDYRRENHLSQKDMAWKLDLSQPMVSKIESGEYNFTIEFLCRICHKLGWDFSVDFSKGINFKFLQDPLELKMKSPSEDRNGNEELCRRNLITTRVSE